MENKGFTLIELLAVIVILAIIFLIAVPQVLEVIEDVKISAYRDDEEMIVKATETYLAVNTNLLPQDIGNTSEISFSDLVTFDYIDQMADSIGECSGYVLVTKVDENNYSYNPELKCGDSNTIDSGVEDGLIAHFDFDEFAEGTINLLPSLPLDLTFDPAGSWYGYLDTVAVVTQGITVDEWDTNTATKIKLTGGTSTLRYLTQGVAPAPLDEPYTGQVKVKNIGVNTVVVDFHYGDGLKVLPGEVKVLSYSTIGNGATNFQIRFESENVGDELEFIAYEPMIEKKSRKTEFTSDLSYGLLIDKSYRSIDRILDPTVNPRWMEENGNGYYLFDGVDDYIPMHVSLSEIVIGNPFSISAWIKTPGLGSGMSMNGIVSLGYGLNFEMDSYGYVKLRYDNGSSLLTFRAIGVDLYDDVFHHVAVTFDGSIIDIFIDGNLEASSSPITYGTRYTNAGAIGYDANNPNYYRFNGGIDDVRIYSRALSDNEIKYQYDINKYKYE